MTQTQESENQFVRFARFLRSPLFPIFMIMFVDVLGVGMTIPVLPLFAQNQFGASAFQITLITSAYFLAQFIASPQLGRMSDKFGRRPVLLVSQSGTLAAFLISGAAVALPFLYLARIIDGFTGGNISVAQAYLSDITDEKNRAQGIGLVNAAFSTGFLFGPAFGAFMAAQFGPRTAYFAAACFSITTILLTYFLLPESLTPERRATMKPKEGAKKNSSLEMLRLPGVAILMMVAFVGQLGFFAFQSVFVLWSEKVMFVSYNAKFVQQAVGFILTYVGVVGIITQTFLVKPIVSRFGERMMVAGGLLTRSLAFAIMALSPLIPLVIVTVPLISFGNGLLMPGLIALLTYLVPPGERGYAIGLAESVQGLGRISGPLVAGFLFDRVNPSAPMGFAAIVGVLGVIVSLSLWRITKKRAPDFGGD
ncbi:MAG: MFS transporter [Chloroflexi bacterium]|nr:MFS transporter [Chloroflexota bacterium]